jgi:uncharacterized protein YlxW (UPF0749 family)
MTHTAVTTSPRRDSMSLLRQIYDEALDPEYVAAARDRVRQGRRTGSRTAFGVVWAVVLGLFAAALAAGWVNARTPDVVTARARLLAQVKEQTTVTDRMLLSVNRKQARVSALRDRALARSLEGAGLSSSVAQLQQAVGQQAVTGAGVSVILDDGPPTETDPGGVDLARVLDQDLRQAVNGLFAAGAEAVSVNGQRIASLTAIRSAGDAILVGYRPLTPPYQISAVGDPATLADRFAAGADAAALRTLSATYGIRFDVTSSADLTVPAGADVTLRYARPAKDRP